MKTLIQKGCVVNAADSLDADVLVENETIAMVGPDLHLVVASVDKTIDAAGKLVIPGGVDPHTHLELSFGGICSSDDFETGTRAAAFGGTTTIIDFAVQHRGEPMQKALDAWLGKAEGKAAIDYGFHMIVTDLPDERLREMSSMIRQGVTSFKLFMAYPGVYMVDDGIIFKAMSAAAEEGGLVCLHAENGPVIDVLVKRALARGDTAPKYHALTRPEITEAEAVHRAIAISEMAAAPVYIVHLSSSDALKEIQTARDRGLAVYAETCPQYLFLDSNCYDLAAFEGAKYVMTPPLRHKRNQELLWNGLRDGHIQVVATDHCPFRLKEKELGRGDFSRIPNGGPGIENRMGLIYHGGVVEGRISANRFVEITSTAAAKIFGLFPRKGVIAPGADADIVVFDPGRRQTIRAASHHMNVDYSLFEGLTVVGMV
jgi:dihydropyrimidinase